ncbi:MAG: GNAT family N-acetyltransferase [Labilithrix sp.]|nr:GNAT family N-acetyltransferase [Labilithrix sp.]MCW5815304.1 GNAT family N-acetyltransferase [Labilithrix sp.]
MRIRAVTLEDLSVWEELWLGYQRFYEAEIPQTVTQRTWARFLDPTEPMWAALAFDADRAVGLVHWLFHRSTWTAGDYCYLQDLFVSAGARGAGVGRALIDHVATDAKRSGAERLYWLTHETNETAMKLYDAVAERSGFVQYRKRLEPPPVSGPSRHPPPTRSRGGA